MNRRELLGGLSVTLLAAGAHAGPPAPAPGAPPAGKPLPFDPNKLKGLSAKLLTSHHDNNYGGALKNLAKVREELERLPADAPGFLVAGLKERELTFGNSVLLHEAYFGNLGGDGKAGAALEQALGAPFGGFAKLEQRLHASALSLAGGSGWVVLGFNLGDGALELFQGGGHSNFAVGSVPLLALDMYEHSYALDYGAAAAKYVDAFFANLKWDEVGKRLEGAKKAHAALRG